MAQIGSAPRMRCHGGSSVTTSALRHPRRRGLKPTERHEGAVDLLLTDVEMPRMSGLELARLPTAARPTLQTLFISGYAENSRLQNGERAGVDFLPKPTTPEVLLSKVRRVLDRRKLI